ncbi:hypothetical protein GKQ77_01480 [Streptomyces sp. BG9H]|uniref:Uncharacterized protein n=1 Tax=Streptomyces anatolicus TaxID=2675858 RepID=A0ABS6YFP3_9ACTN|nr:hypothetical protein [Streptomyces anatolicus]MBW5420241.1 hypothetical protein [Streptomyces anatolicus]
MSALTVAAALDALLTETPSWLPDVRSWEIAEDGGNWVLSGGLADDLGEAKAAHALGLVAGEHGADVSDDGRRMAVPFVWHDTRVQLWYFRPVLRWVVPERCATCPTKLGPPDVRFVKLGEERGAAVVCIPCRDRMHAVWVADTCPVSEDRAEHHWWFSLPDDGWKCTVCRSVRRDPSDPATTVRAAVTA